jgi:alkylation response protein AidB-like acyl-CoA dehydrogenase
MTRLLKAERDNGNFRLSGSKLFVPDAAIADLVICVARNGESHTCTSRAWHGWAAIKAMSAMDATRKIYELTFNDVIVDKEVFSRRRCARRSLMRFK